MRRGIAILLLVTLAVFGAWRLRGQNATGWKTIAPGIEMRTISVAAPQTLGGQLEVVALRVAASRIKVVHGKTADAGEWRKSEKALAVINGGYFDKAGKSLGLRVCDGKKKNSLHNANWGVFFIRKGRPGVLHTRDFKRQYSSLKNITQAVQCGPRLVVDGKTTDLKPQTARRTGIGIQRDGKVIVAISDGALPFDDWAKLWAQKSGLNCRDALNLDGGGSTQISLKTSKKSLAVSGLWPVPDAIAIR